MMNSRLVSFSLALFFSGTVVLTGLQADEAKKSADKSEKRSYEQQVREDGAVAYWRFEKGDINRLTSQIPLGEQELTLVRQGKESDFSQGPIANDFPQFGLENSSLQLVKAGTFYRLTDPGEKSLLDFDDGETLTLEAWVKPERGKEGGHASIISKGRTRADAGNQNYAMRLSQVKNGLTLGFLFRSRGESGNWHRWTSKDVVTIGDGWHHIAISYKFGDPASIRGYIDGVATKGTWDMGGASKLPPVVDNDEVWVGSTMGGNPVNSFQGGLDEVAIYRKALTPQQIASHALYVRPDIKAVATKIPDQGVVVDLYENFADRKSWNFRPPQYIESYEAPGFGFIALPKKYSAKAIHIDRSNPCILRATGKVVIPEGPQRLLVRARNAARLYVDDVLVAETPFHSLGGDNGPVFEIDRSLAPNIRPLHRGDNEKVVEFQGDGKEHIVVLETIVGGGGRRPELGETGVYLAGPNQDFRLLGSEKEYLLTDEHWDAYVASQEEFLTKFNLQRRQTAGARELAYWNERHQWAKEVVEETPADPTPEVDAEFRGNNWIDRFIGDKLKAAGKKPESVVDDATFLRRLVLDITGRMPKPEEIQEFFRDPADQRRQLAIDRLLQSTEWADHWVGYWQDVLAENPNIINPTLNNTGPFRYWIEESFRDNKPFDRFVTELVMMEGSVYFGGPAGFSMSSQNDSPMAAKAHILGEAFLGVEMKCARCHDAPFHDVAQRDLFNLAAMLNRNSLTLPKTSTVPGGSNSLLIEITLNPGDVIEPNWPFEELIQPSDEDKFLRKSDDSRERLAMLITSPHNKRFAPILVNRLWQRYLGYGIVEPVDDWEHANPSHPELLNRLAREFVTSGYDIKRVARLIFQSEAYQRAAVERTAANPDEAYLFAGPLKRRLTAEQLVDSLFSVSGKPMDADVVCIDIDTSRALTLSLNLGSPKRSWQFASLSNERDRPSLSLPFAQPFVTTLETFGWRSSRQDPLTVRETDPNPLQPAEVANGLLARRASTLSDDSAFTRLALQDDFTPEQLVEAVYQRVLTRLPTPAEKQTFVELLQEDFATRRVPGAKPEPRKRMPRSQVAWTNHLHPDASTIKLAMEEEVRRGDPPTVLLNPDWRERMEDMIWALINSPEFVFVP